MAVYLDYNSSAPIERSVVDRMMEVYSNYVGNPDSRTHVFGEKARKVVEDGRKSLANLIGVSSDEVFFTSGATESNNIVLQGLVEYGKRHNKTHIITSSIEHKSVLETAKKLSKQGFEVDFVDPDESGRVSSEKVLSLVKENTLLVSIMHVNNETGIIQPVEELGASLAAKDVFFHVDATQSFGKLVDEIKLLKYDMLSMSAHKISGPQGIGALILRRKNYVLPPVESVYCGGQQENGIRPGTVPVALVAGFGCACDICNEKYREQGRVAKEIKQMILNLLEESGVVYSVNGAPEYCVDTAMNICFDGVSSEALMLSTKDYCCVSNGSACNSKSYSPSYVLKAMGIPEGKIENSIRISWGGQSNLDDVKESLITLIDAAKRLAM